VPATIFAVLLNNSCLSLMAFPLLNGKAMARYLSFLGVVALALVAVKLGGISWATVVFSALAVGGAVVFATRCPHSGPLGLLPPTVDRDGVRHGARWFCPDCSQEWAASFEHDRQPVVRFSGYDEAKAVAAARRAADLEQRVRQLNTARAVVVPTDPLPARVVRLRAR
jgi:hypothetical protein